VNNNPEELRTIGEQLRQVFADERAAIGSLDHARLVTIADTKRELVNRLASLQQLIGTPDVRELFITLREEARATAMLASTANAAVRVLLGYETSTSYDRRARQVTQGPSRILAAY
jgi:hypothetical protein